MQLFENTVRLRGFLGNDAEAPSSDHIKDDSFAVLLLATVSDIWTSPPITGHPASTGIASSVPVHSSAGWFVA